MSLEEKGVCAKPGHVQCMPKEQKKKRRRRRKKRKSPDSWKEAEDPELVRCGGAIP